MNPSLRVEDQITSHSERSEAKLYHCPYCPAFFCTDHDLRLHLKGCKGRLGKVPWKKSDYDDGEIAPSSSDPVLMRQIQINGKAVISGYVISLSGNGLWFKRKRET